MIEIDIWEEARRLCQMTYVGGFGLELKRQREELLHCVAYDDPEMPAWTVAWENIASQLGQGNGGLDAGGMDRWAIDADVVVRLVIAVPDIEVEAGQDQLPSPLQLSRQMKVAPKTAFTVNALSLQLSPAAELIMSIFFKERRALSFEELQDVMTSSGEPQALLVSALAECTVRQLIRRTPSRAGLTGIHYELAAPRS